MVEFRTDKEVLQIMGNCVDFVSELIDYIAEYPDDDYMTMECLCRKLHKYGLVDKKDGFYLVAGDTLRKDAPQTHDIHTNTHECVKDEPQSKVIRTEDAVQAIKAYLDLCCLTEAKFHKELEDYNDEIAREIISVIVEPNSSEIPNNCEPHTDCGDFADRLAYERGVKHAWEVAQKVFDSTVTFYEAKDVAKQIDKDTNVRSKDEPQIDIHDLTDCDFCKDRACKDCEGGKDEPCDGERRE